MIVKEAGIRICRNRSCDTGYYKEYYVVIVHLLSCARLFVTPWTATHQVPLYSTTYWSLLKYMSIELVMVSNYLILCCPHLLLIPVFPRISLFQWLFISDGQSIGVSASVFPMNSQGYFPFGLNGWISLQSKGFSRVFSSTTVQKHQFFGTQLSLQCSSHIRIWLLEIHGLTIGTFVGKLMSLLFNRLSRFVRAFLPSVF